MAEQSGNRAVRIEGGSGQYLLIEVHYRSYPHVSDRWNSNWLNSAVEVKAGEFSGRVACYLRADEFVRFRDQLRRLYDSLEGTAAFVTLEEQLKLTFVGDGSGRIDLEGVLRDQAGLGNTLDFHFALDQTYLPAVLTQLDALIATFPVRGPANR
jgi:hypothetical protein